MATGSATALRVRGREEGSPPSSASVSRSLAPLFRPGALLAVVLLVAGILQLVQVDQRPGFFEGNGDWYLRNAMTYAEGELARSRYSPGFGLLLSPLAWLAGDDLWLLFKVVELAMIPIVVISLFLLHRFLRIYLEPWTAVVTVAAFALGQVPASLFSGVEVEPVVLGLVTAVLLALAGRRPWTAVVLTAAALLTRASLAPFFVVLWLFFLPRHRSSALAGIVVVPLAVGVHVASGPTVDQTYAALAGGARSTSLAEIGERLAGQAIDYLRHGIPQLVLPARVLSHPVGRLASAVVVASIGAGILYLCRRTREAEQHAPGQTLFAAAAASMVMLGALFVWPVGERDTTRMLLPIVGVALLGVGGAAEGALHALEPRRAARRALAATTLALLVTTGAWTTEVVQDAKQMRDSERDFLVVHERARQAAWTGPVISGKPAFTELATGRVAYSYPVYGSVADLARLAERSRSCAFVLHDMGRGTPREVVAWIESRQEREVASEGGARIVTIRARWCEAG